MPDAKNLARFLAVPADDEDDAVLLTIEAEDGTNVSFKASAEQVEDIIDTLDMLFGDDED
ncbi:hypothetical protein [Terrihabitans sp. B22-R8]|uniref:hypothetical protein n=1 Tax=Terrihabitans sp. B22-R8 TaxID=3425128 RepID=UPI00403CB101